jgi:hypothetical protein
MRAYRIFLHTSFALSSRTFFAHFLRKKRNCPLSCLASESFFSRDYSEIRYSPEFSENSLKERYFSFLSLNSSEKGGVGEEKPLISVRAYLLCNSEARFVLQIMIHKVIVQQRTPGLKKVTSNGALVVAAPQSTQWDS